MSVARETTQQSCQSEEAAQVEKPSSEPCDLLADFRMEPAAVSSSTSGTNLLSFDDVKSKPETDAAATASNGKLEDKPLDLVVETLESDQKGEENKTSEVLEPVLDTLEPETVQEDQEEVFVEAVETLSREEETADVIAAVDTPVQGPVLNIAQKDNDVMAPNLEPLVGGAAQDLVVDDTLQHTADVQTVSANQDAVLNLSSNQDAVLELSTDRDAVLSLSTDHDVMLNVTTNQDAVLNISPDQNAVLNVVTNQEEAVLNIATNQNVVDTMPSAPALLDLSETVQLVCREEVGAATEGPLYPRLDSIIEEQEVIEEMTPFSEQDLATLYPNPQLDANPLFIDHFIQQSNQERHELYELLMQYLKARQVLSGTLANVEVCWSCL